MTLVLTTVTLPDDHRRCYTKFDANYTQLVHPCTVISKKKTGLISSHRRSKPPPPPTTTTSTHPHPLAGWERRAVVSHGLVPRPFRQTSRLTGTCLGGTGDGRRRAPARRWTPSQQSRPAKGCLCGRLFSKTLEPFKVASYFVPCAQCGGGGQ